MGGEILAGRVGQSGGESEGMERRIGRPVSALSTAAKVRARVRRL